MAVEQTFKLDSDGLKVFEARFGDKGGALALLEFPTQMREFFLRLSDKADLPDSAPAGAVWEPFIRGWQQDGYYLITLTKADQTAVRPGMIATRMFAIPISQAQSWNALGVLFDILRETSCGFVPEHTIPVRQNHAPATAPKALLACVAHHLIHEDKPTVIIGQGGFDNIVAALWNRIPPDLRATFRFGFSFTPADLSVSQANIVAVPVSCGVRWSGYKFKCDTNWKQPLTDSTAAFLDDAQARDFLGFLGDVGLVFHSFSDYGRYARLWEYWQKRSKCDPDISHALLRSLGTLLPGPEQASRHKEEAIRITADLLRSATPDDILALRSVKADSFQSATVVLCDAVAEWLNARFHSIHGDKDGGLSKVILAVPTSQSAAWQEWIRKGLKKILNPLGHNAAQTIWSLWNDEVMLVEVGSQLPNDTATEQVLVQTFPKTLPTKIYSKLVKWSIDRGWINLMAKSALLDLGFPTAVQLVLEQESGSQRATAIQLLCSEVKPSEVWASAFQHTETELLKCAIKAAKTEPTLWTTAAPNLGRWVELLELAAQADPIFLQNIDVNTVKQRLFETWEDGATITGGICGALEMAGRLEFSSCTNRSRLWPRIPKRFLGSALRNTLKAWLKDYYSKPPTKPELEKELVDILFEPQQINVTFPSHSIMLGRGGITLVEKWGSARDCEIWLNAVLAGSVQLELEIAKYAGKLILNRGWGIVAKAAKTIEEQRGRRDFRPIWTIYYESLGMVEKLAFDYFLWKSPSSIGHQTPVYSRTMFKAVIVTALAEEFSAVKAHLAECRELTDNGTFYEVGNFCPDGIECRVAVVQTGMGNALSAAATERALNMFKPNFALFVGIAGGLRDDLKIGDIIAANKVYFYESGKSAGTFQPRPEAPLVSHEAEQRANAVVRAKEWQKRIIFTMNSEPNAIVKPIAAGEKVLTSMTSEDMKRLKTTFADAHAVAMEDYGFAVTVHKHTSVCFSVVRGISDLIEGKQAADRSGSHDIAARNAAAFAFEMLAGLLRGRVKAREEERPFLD